MGKRSKFRASSCLSLSGTGGAALGPDRTPGRFVIKLRFTAAIVFPVKPPQQSKCGQRSACPSNNSGSWLSRCCDINPTTKADCPFILLIGKARLVNPTAHAVTGRPGSGLSRISREPDSKFADWSATTLTILFYLPAPCFRNWRETVMIAEAKWIYHPGRSPRRCLVSSI